MGLKMLKMLKSEIFYLWYCYYQIEAVRLLWISKKHTILSLYIINTKNI